MTKWRLFINSLRFYWRTNVGVILGVAVAAGVLTGALVVGDSVRYSLSNLAHLRLGKVKLALTSQDRFFRAQLATDMASVLNCQAAAVLHLRGMITNNQQTQRVNQIQVLGVDDNFWKLSPSGKLYKLQPGQVVLNRATSGRLGVKTGDEVLLLVTRPGRLPQEMSLLSAEDNTAALHLKVKAVVGNQDFGRFELQANQASPYNVYIQLAWLNTRLKTTHTNNDTYGQLSPQKLARANMLLLSDVVPSVVDQPLKSDIRAMTTKYIIRAISVKHANDVFKKCWSLDDLGLKLNILPALKQLQLSSKRIFISNPVIKAALQYTYKPMTTSKSYKPMGVLSYFVNKIAVVNKNTVNNIGRTGNVTDPGQSATITDQSKVTGKLNTAGNRRDIIQPPPHKTTNRFTPYSMISALGKSSLNTIIPSDMADDEIVINQWLADDLQVGAGDKLALTYYVMGPLRKLRERMRVFRIRRIVPVAGLAADRTLMPDFPGLSDVDNCRNWKPGIPIDFNLIRDKDEAYWDKYRGTPKGFITLSAGQRLWGNRFGRYTAVRYMLLKNIKSGLSRTILNKLNPASLGFYFRPVQTRAIQASSKALDFGQLFLSMSFFIIAAAVLLTALLFVFGIEQRHEEMAVLLTVGFTKKQLKYQWLSEGVVLCMVGTLLGLVVGLGYTRIILYSLHTVWQNAVASSIITFHATMLSLIYAICINLIACIVAIWLTLRSQCKYSPRQILYGNDCYDSCDINDSNGNSGYAASDNNRTTKNNKTTKLPTPMPSRINVSLWLSLACFVFALVAVYLSLKGGTVSPPGFFIAGTLLLISWVCGNKAFMNHLSAGLGHSKPGFLRFALQNSLRRPGRSLAIVILIACGSFMTFAVGANYRNPRADARNRSSGTGGFAFIAETTLPVYYDLNTAQARKQYTLSSDIMKDVSFVNLRVRNGDNASCLNLNRALVPRLLGVKPSELAKRRAFTFIATINGKYHKNPWQLLSLASNVVRSYVSTSSNSVNSNTNTSNNSNNTSNTRAQPCDIIPAIGDQATIKWALGKKVGDEIPLTDDNGKPVKLLLVAAVNSSILQGALLISDAEFMRHFPSQQGCRMFLIDCPAYKQTQISAYLTRSLRNVGFAIEPAWQKLARFETVEDSYLSIFQILSSLGLVIGTVALGLVVMRNVLERRSELALLGAVGFTHASLRQLILYEHWFGFASGITGGVLAALVAVWPALQNAGRNMPWQSLFVTLIAIIFSGIIWIWLSTRLALKGPLINALRNE